MSREKHTEKIEFWHRGLPYLAYVESPIIDNGIIKTTNRGEK